MVLNGSIVYLLIPQMTWMVQSIGKLLTMTGRDLGSVRRLSPRGGSDASAGGVSDPGADYDAPCLSESHKCFPNAVIILYT